MENLTLPTTTQEVLDELDSIIASAITDNSFLGIFAFVYRRVTAQIKNEIELGNFEDNERMELFDVIFANRYIDAVRNHKNNQPVSQAWKIAFDCQKDSLSITQHLLIGMNAHINLDLSIAASVVMQGKRIQDLQHDFDRINEILAGLTNEVQSKLGNVSKLVFILDVIGKNTDEKILDFSMKKARGFAWKNAVQLSALSDADKQVRIGHIDNVVLALGECIKAPRSIFVQLILKVIQYFEVKEVAKVMEGLDIPYDPSKNAIASAHKV